MLKSIARMALMAIYRTFDVFKRFGEEGSAICIAGGTELFVRPVSALGFLLGG